MRTTHNFQRRRLFLAMSAASMGGCSSITNLVNPSNYSDTPPVPPKIVPIPLETQELVDGVIANLRAYQGVGPYVRKREFQINAAPVTLPTFGLKLDLTSDPTIAIKWALSQIDGVDFYNRADLLQRVAIRRSMGLDADPNLVRLLELPMITLGVAAFQMASQESERLFNGGIFGVNAEANLARQRGYTVSSIVVTASSSSATGRSGQGGEARIEGTYLRVASSSDNASGGVLALSVGGASATRTFNSPYAATEFLLILALVKVLSHEMRAPLTRAFLRQDYGLADDPVPVKRELAMAREFRFSDDPASRKLLAIHLSGQRALCNGGTFGRNPTDLADTSTAFTRGSDNKWRCPVQGVPAIDSLPMLVRLEREGFIRDKFEAEFAMLHVAQLSASPQLRDRVQATRNALNASVEETPSAKPECPAKGMKCPPKGPTNPKK